MKIFIYGAGAFALALGSVLNSNGHDILFYCRDKMRSELLNKTHIENKYFENLKLSDKLLFTSNIDEIREYNIILIAVPSHSIKDVVNTINTKVAGDKILLINATKGLEPSTNTRILEYLRNNLTHKENYYLADILGPGFAKNIINQDLTCVNAVSFNLNVAQFVQRLFSNAYFRVYALDDEVGAEYSGSIKNAIAIASGILCGLGYKENSRSALITRGLAELVRFGTYFGAKKDTFFGLTGVGDLILTCSSYESRNFLFGEQIGISNEAKTVIERNTKTVEGLGVVKVVYKIANEKNIDMPIINALYKILFEHQKPSDILAKIMTRPLRVESF